MKSKKEEFKINSKLIYAPNKDLVGHYVPMDTSLENLLKVREAFKESIKHINSMIEYKIYTYRHGDKYEDSKIEDFGEEDIL